MSPAASADHAAIAASLAQLTSGWTPTPGIAPDTLTAAREALVASLLAGHSASDLHIVQPAVRADVPAEPRLAAELGAIATRIAAGPRPATTAIVRSPLAATLTNPTGVPAWARSAQVPTSLGPFLDIHGLPHWVDLIRITASMPIAFGNAASPFGVLPVRRLIPGPPAPTQLTLVAGSVWFTAKWLAATLPDGFTGFSITGGTLASSAPLSLQNGVYVAPAGATLTLKCTLAPAPVPAGPAAPGADALAARFMPPLNITIVFKQSSAVLQAVGDASATAYGSSVAMHYGQQPPVSAPGLPQIVIPFAPAPANFAFATVASTLFTPSGTGSISHAGWGLPLAATAIASLPETAGPGVGVLQLHTGAALKTQVAPTPAPVSDWIIEIATGSLFVVALGKGKSAPTTFTLWAEGAPSKLHATVDFATNASVAATLLAAPGNELLAVGGAIKAHVDRPLAATGARFPYASAALLLIDRSATADLLALIATRADQRNPVIPIALQNALIGVDAPAVFTLAGPLKYRTVQSGIVAMYFDARWLLPILPDPYAANFDLSLVSTETNLPSVGTLLAATSWAAPTDDATLQFLLLPPPAPAGALAATPFRAAIVAAPTPAEPAAASPGTVTHAPAAPPVPPPPPPPNPALLDLSTRVDLFGVAFLPNFSRLATAGIARIGEVGALTPIGETGELAPAAADTPAPLLALEGMQLALNGAAVATFALPQVSWEPMLSTGGGMSGPIIEDPASDGLPLLVAAQDDQQLVPFMPDAVLLNNISNVARGVPFSALFSLPFGLNALVLQPNHRMPRGAIRSSFVFEGGRFYSNRPQFPLTIPPSPPGGAPTPPTATGTLTGAVSLTMMPTFRWNKEATFPGGTFIAGTYGEAVLGPGPNSPSDFFRKRFTNGQPSGHPSVPLRRIDFTGYGASIFSQWALEYVVPPDIIKVEFETIIGRTAYEVVEAVNAIQPYWVPCVRTVTIERHNAGWVKRTDSGWTPVGPGVFKFPSTDWDNRVHQGALVGVFNVRNIREQPEMVSFPSADPNTPFSFQKVLFDADLGVDPSIKVVTGGFTAPVEGVTNPPVLVASRDLVGYMQTAPLATVPGPAYLKMLFDKVGNFTPAAACTVEAGGFGGAPGVTLRSSVFEVGMITGTLGAPVPALGVALRGAPVIPTGGGWSLGHRSFTEPAPSALPAGFPVPLVRPATEKNFWYVADVADVLQIANPDSFYSLMHATGTHKVLFETPQIPLSAAVGPQGPGFQFPKPAPAGPPKPGAAPINPGSPNLGDVASILNSTGLFPDIGAALSLLEGAAEQIKTIDKGIQYTKNHTFDPNTQVTVADISVLRVVLQYADTTPIRSLDTGPGPKPGMTPAAITYSVNSAASPSWTLTIGPLSLLVSVPAFGAKPLLTITGGFYADEHTRPGMTGLNVQFGDALSILKQVFSALQTLAQFLPGGAKGGLDVALSDGKLTVSDTVTVSDLPLGCGNLTNVSVNLGLRVGLQPISVDFSVALGEPNNPFNWIVSPLAGNGLILLGVQNSAPALIIQAGIGLGLAIDLGIASGSASVVLAFQVQVAPPSITLMIILTGQASVDVLDGLASASLTLSAALGLSLTPLVPPITINPALPAVPTSITIGEEFITLIATCSVGIHLSICWVVSVDWDGSWNFQQTVNTPAITLSI
ncbi:MAG: hypothetical protein ACXWI1_02195 [Croceibacterium sp.]